MILLKEIQLINWYGFSLEKPVPIGRFTLIAGKNGNGKSVLLDAIKYALYGDTAFNKSTENKTTAGSGSRTLLSYTRGFLDATARTCMRPSATHPNVYTHIALGMYDEESKSSFVLGTVIETSSSGYTTKRYIMENTVLESMELTYMEGGQSYACSAAELQKKYGFTLMDALKGIDVFMNRTGLRLQNEQLKAFRRKLHSIISYSPDSKTDEFIRRYVLEEKKIDFKKLIDAKASIDKLHNAFDAIQNDMTKLEEILRLFKKLESTKASILSDDIKIEYKVLLDAQTSVAKANEQITEAKLQLAHDEKEEKELSDELKKLNEILNQAKKSLSEMDCHKSIESAHERLNRLTEEINSAAAEKERLKDFQDKIIELTNRLSPENMNIANCDVLLSLTKPDFSAAKKEACVLTFKSQLEQYRDTVVESITRLKDDLEENKRLQVEQQNIIDDCKAKRVTFDTNYVKVKNAINKEFEKRGIQSQARFACEYVIGLTDESWRNAIEAFLGGKRYTILVDPEYYSVADNIFNALGSRYAHMFNTRLLMKKAVRTEENSVFKFLIIKNPIAAKYFAYQLGRMRASSIENVREFENAMSPEGRVSVAMDGYFLNFKNIKFYCLGQETIQLNLERAQRELKELSFKGDMLLQNYQSKARLRDYIADRLGLFSSYSFDAYRLYDKKTTEYNNQLDELKRLEYAQRTNSEWLELNAVQENCTQRIEATEKKLDACRWEKLQMQIKLTTSSDVINEKMSVISAKQTKLEEYRHDNCAIYEKAVADYDNYRHSGSAGDIFTESYRRKLLRDKENIKSKLTEAQVEYNIGRDEPQKLPIGDDCGADYELRKNKIQMDNIQEVKNQLSEQTSHYKSIFKNEFVLTIYACRSRAIRVLKDINRELMKLTFESKYKFDVKDRKDSTDYANILAYAKYLKEHHEEFGAYDNQLALDSMSSYTTEESEKLEKEIEHIISRIVESNDNDEIDRYADYRNYMTYEILIKNDVLDWAKLSEQSGYNSGAEVQIPYLLILLSALLMIYNEKLNSTRLVFMDEPFTKMDPANVKIMLDFMKEQNLQMIFCAPDKTELIGSKCDVVLPVLRTGADTMEIGVVEFHKEV